MYDFPHSKEKLKRRISSYRSSFKKEMRDYGRIRDGNGKRYILFCLYLVLDDLTKSKEYIDWYEREFTDDVGEPIQKLCWALILYRLKDQEGARYMLGNLMLSNLYLIPHILGESIDEYDMWHASNHEYIDYVNSLPDEVVHNIEQSEREWMRQLYSSLEFRRIRGRYIEIYQKLQNTNEREERARLLDESYSLLDQLR